MKTRTWPYGTTRKAKILVHGMKPIGSNKNSRVVLAEDDHQEGHVLVGDCTDGEVVSGDTGTITFTKGGPTGGYWKFTKDNKP